MTAPYAVIGIGNTLRRDDGVGARVVDALRTRVEPSFVELITCHQLLPEVIDSLRGRRGVIFVDAAIDLAAGRVRGDAVTVDTRPWAWGHRLDPGTLLGFLADADRPRARTFAIGAGDLEFGEELSATVGRAVPETVDRILATLEDWSD